MDAAIALSEERQMFTRESRTLREMTTNSGTNDVCDDHDLVKLLLQTLIEN